MAPAGGSWPHQGKRRSCPPCSLLAKASTVAQQEQVPVVQVATSTATAPTRTNIFVPARHMEHCIRLQSTQLLSIANIKALT
mmetsp:Transcript_20413/g.43139  ORF Transcript_20413/g.43139 Transcript_20413/m.43139 type:complete len:82 (+) Transcript_20413:848-1093(+)